MVVFGAPAAEFPKDELAPEAPTVPFPLAAAVEVFVLLPVVLVAS